MCTYNTICKVIGNGRMIYSTSYMSYMDCKKNEKVKIIKKRHGYHTKVSLSGEDWRGLNLLSGSKMFLCSSISCCTS